MGIWVSVCYSNDGSVEHYEYSFCSDTVETTHFLYDPEDLECGSPVETLITTYAVSYLSGTQSTSLGEARKVDFSPVAYTDNVNWFSDVDGIPADIVDEYRIFLLLDDRLYGGDFFTGNGQSPEERATEIDTEDYLVRG